MSFLNHLKGLVERFADRIAGDAKDIEADAMAAFRNAIGEAKAELASFGDGLKRFGVEHMDEIFSVLRRVQPILVTKELAIVTRYEDVQEVLAADEAFDVPYAERMREITDGENFFLGMRDTPRYTRDHSNMMVTMRREDVAGIITPFIAQLANQIVAQASAEVASGARSFDVVTELTRVGPARLVASYFGVGGDDEAGMVRWASALFWYLFLDQAGDPEVQSNALSASKELNAVLDGAIAARKVQSIDVDDVLARCLAQQSINVPGTTDLDIRNNLVGLVIGAIPTTATTAALALDELLKRPEALAGARAAAQAEDDDLVARYVFEALRFNPMNPGIFRIARRNYVVARDERRATLIPEGMTVIAATRSAMFDGLDVEKPGEFRVDRPSRDYMLWGYGMHTCFGQYINQVQIPQLLKPLLQREKLRRAEGADGNLTLEGPFAGSLRVVW